MSTPLGRRGLALGAAALVAALALSWWAVPRGRVLSGRLFAPGSANPLGGAVISVSGDGRAWRAVSASDGTFRVGPLDDGAWQLTIESDAGTATWAPFITRGTPRALELELELPTTPRPAAQPAPRCETHEDARTCRVAWPDGGAVAGAQVSWLFGRVELEDVTDGAGVTRCALPPAPPFDADEVQRRVASLRDQGARPINDPPPERVTVEVEASNGSGRQPWSAGCVVTLTPWVEVPVRAPHPGALVELGVEGGRSRHPRTVWVIDEATVFAPVSSPSAR